MEAKTMTTEGAEFMRDILSGDEKALANYIKSVGFETACSNIYKLAEYANDLTVQIEGLADMQEEARKAKECNSMYDYYRDEYYKADDLAKSCKARIGQLMATIKGLAAIIAEQ